MTFSRNFWFLNGYRLTSYLKLMDVSNWSPNCWMLYRWPVGCIKREENDINIGKPFIHKAAVSGINETFPSFSWTYSLFFINQGLTDSVHSVLQLCQFILVYAKKFKSLSIYVCLFPHYILLFLNWVSLVLLGFFSRQILIIVLFCEVFFTIEIEKSYATLHEITHDRYFT